MIRAILRELLNPWTWMELIALGMFLIVLALVIPVR